MPGDSQARAVFLDRDGPIIIDKHYMHDPSVVELAPGAASGLRLLREHGFQTIVISDQSGVGRGYFTETAAWTVHNRMLDLLKAEKIHLDACYYCFHAPDDRCSCRKPQPTSLLRAAKEHSIDLSRSFMGGDKPKDILTGQNTNPSMQNILIGEHESEKLSDLEKQSVNYYAANLLDAANWIISQN